MLNLEKIKLEKYYPPPPRLRRPVPTPHFHPVFFFNYSDSEGDNKLGGRADCVT